MVLERIQKILAAAGVASRREAEQWIAEGRVTVNGQVVDSMGFKVDPGRDFIKVDGKRVHRPEQKLTLLLHKPRNVVCTVKDPQERPTVMDLVTNVRSRVYPVGRLDFDAEGLLVMTNDGDLANLLTHPRYGVPRTYLAKVSGIPEEGKLERLRKGVFLEDGWARAVRAAILRPGDKNAWVKVVVTEGRNHLVKKMLQSVGHPVAKLKRVEFGPFVLGRLPVGQFRIVPQEEVEQIKVKLSQAKPKEEESSDQIRPPKRPGRSSRPWAHPQEEVEQAKQKPGQSRPGTKEPSDRPDRRPPKRPGRSEGPWASTRVKAGQAGQKPGQPRPGKEGPPGSKDRPDRRPSKREGHTDRPRVSSREEGGQVKREERQPWPGKGGASDRPDRRPPKREGRSEGPWAPPRNEGSGQFKQKPGQPGPGKKGPSKRSSGRPSGRPGRKERAERKKR